MSTQIREPIDSLGSRQSWAWHFALVGAMTSFLAPGAAALSIAPLPPGYFVVAGFAGGFTGLAYGALLRRFIWYRLGEPFHGLAYLVPLTGAIWGAVVGAIAGALVFGHDHGGMVPLSIACAGIVGGIQMLWLWHPYRKFRERGDDVNGLIVVAGVVSVILGVVAPHPAMGLLGM